MSLNDLTRRPELCEFVWGMLWVKPSHTVEGDVNENAFYKLYHLCEFPDSKHVVSHLKKADPEKFEQLEMVGDEATKPVSEEELADALEILQQSNKIEVAHNPALKTSYIRALPI